MKIDGRAIAESIYIELAERRKNIAGTVSLGIIVALHDPVIESFVRIKSRAAMRLNVELRRLDLLNQPQSADALAAIEQLGPKVGGIIVQLPLPEALDTDAILSALPPFLDVDGINPTVSDEERFVLAPVAGAIEEILKRSNIETKGRKCVVVGAGKLVGIPAAYLMRCLGADVSVVTLESGSLDELKDADIAILGAGNPGFVKPEMIKEGVTLIDAGTSEQGGKVRGDADPACAEKASLFTPVPGGLGPIAVAMIFKNLFDLLERHV
jgi:methylenetetrahydrofolate dehydrogenase (NADP+)/methenyltetrahydrofolate cyclohydrolase